MSAKLKHGPYLTPSVISGCRVYCLVRGLVNLVGLSDAPIPWPIGEKDGEQSLVVYRGLARALKCETATAIAAAWGVPIATVEHWRANAAERPPYYDGTPFGGKPRWTPKDDAMVVAITNDYEAARKLGRTPGAGGVAAARGVNHNQQHKVSDGSGSEIAIPFWDIPKSVDVRCLPQGNPAILSVRLTLTELWSKRGTQFAFSRSNTGRAENDSEHHLEISSRSNRGALRNRWRHRSFD